MLFLLKVASINLIRDFGRTCQINLAIYILYNILAKVTTQELLRLEKYSCLLKLLERG